MKNLLYIKLIFLAAIFFLGSCSEDIMNYKDPNNYDTESFFNTPGQISQASTAIYVSFQYNNMFGFQWPEMFDALGNELDGAPAALSNEANIVAFWKYQLNSTNSSISGYWRMLYKMVLRSNLVIYKAEEYLKTKGQDATVSRSLGEAYFLRGWAYFQLAFYWGRVPIRTELNQVGKEDAPRAAKAEDVWAVAEGDFKKAQELLPESYDAANLGRATRGAATGFLGKLYLYNKKYTEADAEFAKLDGKYSLLPLAKWMDNFGEKNENNQESVFEVQFAWVDGNFLWGNFTEPEGNGVPSTQNSHAQLYSWTDWANWRFQPLRINDFKYTDETGNAYVDPRASLTFFEKKAPGSIGDSTYCDNSSTGKITFTQSFPWYKKYTNKEDKPNENFMQSGNNVRLMRYADVLLMRAECKLQTGDVAGAIGFINQVRDRIGAFKYTKTYTKDQAFELLKRERLVELMGEQHRYNDLKRWGILKETINPELQTMFGAQNVQDKHYLFPIPQIEIDSNLGLGSVENGWN